MNGGPEGVEVAADREEEEVRHSVSLKGNIAVSLCMACLPAVVALASSELGPAAAVCCAGLAGAASFGWGVFLGGETERMPLDDGDDD